MDSNLHDLQDWSIVTIPFRNLRLARLAAGYLCFKHKARNGTVAISMDWGIFRMPKECVDLKTFQGTI